MPQGSSMFIFFESTSNMVLNSFVLLVIGLVSVGVWLLIRYLRSDRFVVKIPYAEKQMLLDVIEKGFMSSKICEAAIYEFEESGSEKKILVIIYPDSNEVAVLDLGNLSMDILNIDTHKATTRNINRIVGRQPNFISFFKETREKP